MLNRWGGWLILISLALGTTWLVQSLEKQFSTVTESHDHVPDYTMQNFTSTQMDEQGILKNKLTAEMMTHYPETNTNLTTPLMVFYKNEQPTWTVRAEQGEVSPDGEQVWLLGHTTIQRETAFQEKPMKIISRDVWIRLDTEYAETAAPTTILTENSETHSIGMRVFMPTEQIELLSQVRGHYVLP
jgi:lipopolysaccharide export system protein LptC